MELEFRRIFKYLFIVADITTPIIIGADFYVHFGLIVNLKNRKLMDLNTTLSTTS